MEHNSQTAHFNSVCAMKAIRLKAAVHFGAVAHDLQAISSHAGHATRVTQESHFLNPAIPQNLSANAVTPQVHSPSFRCVGGFGCALELGQKLIRILSSIQEHQDPCTFLTDDAQTLIQTPRVHLPVGLQEVNDGQGLMNTNQDLSVLGPLALNECQVHALGQNILVGVGNELTVLGGQGSRGDLLQQALIFGAVLNQVSNGADVQVMLRSKSL